MGLLVVPRPENAVEWCPDDSLEYDAVGLSLQSADRTNALQLLADAGWTLLEKDSGAAQGAGHTAACSLAVCLYTERMTYEQLVLEDFHRAFAALWTAADLQPDR